MKKPQYAIFFFCIKKGKCWWLFWNQRCHWKVRRLFYVSSVVLYNFFLCLQPSYRFFIFFDCSKTIDLSFYYDELYIQYANYMSKFRVDLFIIHFKGVLLLRYVQLRKKEQIHCMQWKRLKRAWVFYFTWYTYFLVDQKTGFLPPNKNKNLYIVYIYL